MRIGIATSFACGVGMWKRLADEGHDVKVWRGAEKGGVPHVSAANRYVGKGIVPLEDSWHGLLNFCRQAPSIMLFDSSGLGMLADDARQAGITVIGGGKFCDRLEKDRSFGRSIAEGAGILTPPYVEFSGLDACIDYANEGKLDRPVYWKTDVYLTGDSTHKCETAQELIDYLTWIKQHTNPNIKCVLEDVLDGCALSTARWWNGRAWVGPYEWTFEQKGFMAENIGPSTGCAINAVGFYEDDTPLIAHALHWDRLTPAFRSNNAPPGLYDINAIVDDGDAYFLEWTPRFGWDSEGTSFLLYPEFSAWLNFIATGSTYSPEPQRDQFATGLRLTVAPAPWEHGERDEPGSAVGVYVRGKVGNLYSDGFVGYQLMESEEMGLAVAAPEGLVGLATAIDDDLADAAETTRKRADAICTASRLQYRPDLGKAIAADAKKCWAAGFDDIPSGLLTGG